MVKIRQKVNSILSGRRKVECKRSQPIYEKCAVVFNVLCKRNQCVVGLFPTWPMWSRNLTPSTQGTRPPSLSAGPRETYSTSSDQQGWIWTV